MIVKISICLLVFSSLISCNTHKRYFQSDYSFYDKNFQSDPASLLRKDGIYVQQKIRTNENGGKETIPTERKIYKFYKGGQANIVLDPTKKLKTAEDYIHAFNNRIKESREQSPATLFERYYREEGNRLVIQAVNKPLNQFYYEYALLEKDALIIVKSTIEGKGKIEDKYYTDYYKEIYKFIPTGETAFLEPNW